MLSNIISALELRRQFIKSSALLVGHRQWWDEKEKYWLEHHEIDVASGERERESTRYDIRLAESIHDTGLTRVSRYTSQVSHSLSISYLKKHVMKNVITYHGGIIQKLEFPLIRFSPYLPLRKWGPTQVKEGKSSALRTFF